MSNHKSLIFFNKEGDALNVQYNEATDRFEADIIFDENSSDTYKTYGLYTMERIPSFEFEAPDLLNLEKFQLFNEWGFHFYGGITTSQPVIAIEPVNNHPDFYSKWIYGYGLDAKYPTGSIIRFQNTFLEFTNTERTYVVISVKKDAIMIITEVDNASFETNYYSQYSDTNNFYTLDSNNNPIYKIYIKLVNAVGIYNYIDSNLRNNLSKWSEPDFYDKVFTGQKLNVIGSDKNDGILTIDDIKLTDQTAFEYWTSNILDGQDLTIEYVSKGDLPRIYDGKIEISDDGYITISQNYPDILKAGTDIRISGSIFNTETLTITTIPDFEQISKSTYFATASQVLYSGIVYDCTQAYTENFTTNIKPNNSSYWKISRRIRVNQKTTKETLLNAQIYLTTDKISFTQTYVDSSSETLAMAAERYAQDLETLGIDLYCENGILKADLTMPSKYAEVNFYSGTQSIGKVRQTNERLLEVKETVTSEMNYNMSENFMYNIVFTDIDDYGIKITINKQVYQEEAALINTGPYIDIQRSIDRTLRLWLERNYMALHLLGINAELSYIGNQSSQFFNAITITTEYPNVPIILNSVEVGTGGDFHIEHSRVLFTNSQSIGSYLNININGKDYIQQTITMSTSTTFIPDIPKTLTAWVEQHGDYLSGTGLYITDINNMLKFDIKRTDIDFTYSIKTGKIQLPGSNDVIITRKMKGNKGVLITSNMVTLPKGTTMSFEDAGFATGMGISINNTIHPYMNTEFNILYIDKSNINLSYQGPFWGLTGSLCTSSPFVTVAFNSGFGQTACVAQDSIGEGSPFDLDQFDNRAFSRYKNPTIYTNQTLPLYTTPGTTNMVDIKYIQLNDKVFILGDGLVVIDATSFEYVTYIDLPMNTGSIKMEYNDTNNYIYCLTTSKVYLIDPLIYMVVSTITLTNTGYDILINPDGGDVYISFSDSPTIKIYDWQSNQIKYLSSTGTRTGKMVWNALQGDIYVTNDGDELIRIDGTTRTLVDSYTIPGLKTDRLFYDPAGEGVYAWGTSYIYKVLGSSIITTPIQTQPFGDAIFNNLTGEINISDNTKFTSLTIDTDIVSISESIGEWGYITLNQYDGTVYLTDQSTPHIISIDPSNGWVIHTENTNYGCTRLIYNPSRKSIWAIQPESKSIYEVTPTISTTITPTTLSGIGIDTQKYGTLSDGYTKKDNVWIKTREYLRRPRENYQGDVQVQFLWEWADDQTPEFFLYDTSGDQLPTSGSYSYTGPKPLGDVALNYYPNRDISKTTSPEYQQTVFDTLTFNLDYLDSSTDVQSTPSTMQTFIGFKSIDEGPKTSILKLYKREPVSFSITSTKNNDTIISFKTILDNNGNRVGEIRINESSTETFNDRGLKSGQLLMLEITDTTNISNQYNSFNTGSVFRISEIYTNVIIVNFISTEDYLDLESTIVNDWPTTNKTTYLKTKFSVIDREIARFQTYAQTEIEDVRFKINLNNIGKNITPHDVFIFKDYDIQEGGVDWPFLNTKRKEMLMNKGDIYKYVGAYKSIINAINYFGYNDLKLNEYYKNTNTSSKDFGKLFKVEIPDIFDNTITGWTENDFMKHTFPNENYEVTNLMNLTYDITDKDGNDTLSYSIDEVTIKLQGLKYWLSKNVIPLTHRIKDITGNTYFNGTAGISHQLHDVRIINTNEDATPITFKLNEAYLLPVNSGSTVYNCTIDFYTILDGGEEKSIPVGMSEAPKPYWLSNPILPDYYSIKVKTYKTYKEWNTFTTYTKGDRISYYEKLYESTKSSNKLNNPKKYDGVLEWVIGINYNQTDIVKYQGMVYTYSGLGNGDSQIPPLLNQGDNGDWLDITEWVEIPYEPVQVITETRNTNPGGLTYSTWPLPPFNFTIDSNIDPFITIEVTSDNGYGGVFTDKKNYELRGIKDLGTSGGIIEKIGPFQPINLI